MRDNPAGLVTDHFRDRFEARRSRGMRADVGGGAALSAGVNTTLPAAAAQSAIASSLVTPEVSLVSGQSNVKTRKFCEEWWFCEKFAYRHRTDWLTPPYMECNQG